jgi:glutathione S-transferase
MGRDARKLFFLRASPWSERAKWALDHHGLAYEVVDHTPFLGELRLRRVAGGGGGKKRVTTPVLVDDGRVLTESWDIALYADQVGNGSKLVPANQEVEIRKWNDVADQAMQAGRALLIPRIRASGQALDSTLPPLFPKWVRPALRPMTRYATDWFTRKYALRLDEVPAHLAQVRSALLTLRAALARSSPYLLGSFSYADIVMATTLQCVRPVDDRYFPIDPAMRVAWTREDLVADFGDLLAWRDRLYEGHRK